MAMIHITIIYFPKNFIGKKDLFNSHCMTNKGKKSNLMVTFPSMSKTLVVDMYDKISYYV